MKKFLKACLALTLIVGTMAVMTACEFGGVTKKDATAYVQGEFDAAYLGKYNKDYMKLLEIDEKEAQDTYDWNISEEARITLLYFAIDYPTDAHNARAQELVKKIYSYAKYEIMPAEKTKDGDFEIEVKVSPMDIYQQITDEDLQAIWTEVSGGVNGNDMTQEEYEACDSEYADRILDLIESKIPNIGYENEQTITIRLELDSDNMYVMNEDDWREFDDRVIDYSGDYA